MAVSQNGNELQARTFNRRTNTITWEVHGNVQYRNCVFTWYAKLV